MERVVRIPSAYPSTQRADNCDMCGPFLKDILHLEEHETTHPEKTPYICGACGREFWFRANLHQHQKGHDGERPFRWDKNRDLFMRSSVVFLSEKPFICGDGSKDTSDSHDLLHYSAIDSSGKLYSTECREAFPHSSNLGQLPKVHTIEKLFKCSDCGKTFQKSSTLLNHLRTYSVETPFRCPTVENSLEDKLTFVNHQKFHTAETSHVCREYDKVFSHPSKQRKHQKVHAGDEQV